MIELNEIEKERQYWEENLSSRLSKKSFDLIADTLLNYDCVQNGVGLEIGCGEGRLIKRLPKIFGIDLSILGIRKAKGLGLDLLQADATRLPFMNEKFDYIVTNSLHHMPHKMVLKEMYRVMKPGGYVFCFEPNRWHLYNFVVSQGEGHVIVGDRGYYPSDLQKELIKYRIVNDKLLFIALTMERIRLLSLIQGVANFIPSRFFRAWFFLASRKEKLISHL